VKKCFEAYPEKCNTDPCLQLELILVAYHGFPLCLANRFSVFGMLNKCVTARGHQLLRLAAALICRTCFPFHVQLRNFL